MQCPKEPKIELTPGNLSYGLQAQCCPECGGAWIPPEHYGEWQQRQGIDPGQEPQVEILPSQVALNFASSPLDNRAALCPDCRHYLVRGRVALQNVTFFVERCPNCKGYWCDRGEWPVLETLKLDKHLEYIFADSWQTKVRQWDLLARERQATMDKLGPDIANKIFELADLLEDHPNGDFGVAYLMRRFEQ